MDSIAKQSENLRIFFQNSALSRKMKLEFVSAGLLLDRVSFHCKPRVREDYLILTTLSGTAWVRERDRKRNLQKGDWFLLQPGLQHEYCDITPWSFLYVHVGGELVGETLSKIGFLRRQTLGFRLRSSQGIHLLNQLVHSGDRVTPAAEMMRNAVLLELLVTLHEDYAEDRTTGNRIEMLCEQIERRLTEPLTLPELAKEVGMSTFHFCRSFRDVTGIPPMQYIQKRRILQAGRLLLDSQTIKVGEVAEMVGFQDPLYFSRVFKKWTGMPPAQYRDFTHMHDE